MKTKFNFTWIFFLFTSLFIYMSIVPMSITQMNAPDLDAWLTKHPLISGTIRWEDNSGIKTYSNWSATQKTDLLNMFQKIWNSEPLGLTDPPPNMTNLADEDIARTMLSKDHAWPLFLAYIAHSLVVETDEWVSWSLTEYSEEELSELFDGTRMFRFDNNLEGYELRYKGTPAPPDFTYEFLNTNNMVDEDRLKTIGNLLDWCRSNMIHFTGRFNAKNMEGHWQYRGEAPASRVINGTTSVFYASKKDDTTPPTVESGHFTAGCWGTTAFLRAVLRTVNIPVKGEIGGEHSLPHFISEDKYLSHGDDPYNAAARNFHHPHPFPVEELFIDQDTFNAWFGPGVHRAGANVGRRTIELAIEYLPHILLKLRCQDIERGRSNADSAVYTIFFQRIYSVEELQTMNLWGRIDEKINRLGGCETVSPSPMKSVKISEIMLASDGGNLPQWIELHNHSTTQEVNIEPWALLIRNYQSDDFKGELNLQLTLRGYIIKPGETLLIVSKQGRSSDNLPQEQIYNLDTTHAKLQNIVINEKGFYIRLRNQAWETVDEIGNLDSKRNTNDTLTWQLPIGRTAEGERSSLMRRYSTETLMPLDGTDANNWVQSSELKLAVTGYWGNTTDIGNPSHRGGVSLPVQLSSFQALHTNTGVILKWTTESEVDNAGFYIYRSKTKDGDFKLVNSTMIKGAGTTGERNEYSWTDTTAKPNTVYYYRIEDVSHAGEREQLATVRLRGFISARGKLTTAWANLKMSQ